jgi:hypothetical protein
MYNLLHLPEFAVMRRERLVDASPSIITLSKWAFGCGPEDNSAAKSSSNLSPPRAGR